MNYKMLKPNFFTTIYALTFCLLLAIPASAQSSADSQLGVLVFDQETIDYGTVAYNSNGNKTFTFKNVGKSPVLISQVKSSCGCTVAKKPNLPILPGASSQITVKYATNRVGAFSKSITVISNARENRQLLKIKGKVLAAKSRK